ncbi:MAG: hypothetical protein Q8S17_09530, partial [Humidesulfovibrio sp.]|nr:hypothetical protein [Humidesulfovibrio sp.]
DPYRHDLLPGQSVKLSRPLPYGVERLDELRLRSSDPRISARFEEIFSGFWMGGALWRAEAQAAKDSPVGEYSVAVFHQNGTAAAPPQTFSLHVHANAQSILDASGSLVTRFLGLAPYFLAICLLPLALLPMAASFMLTRRIAQALSDAHMAEVYRSMNSPEGQRIYFCPAQGQMPAPGALVDVLDEGAKNALCVAQVIEIENKNVIARMQVGVQVRPGALVRLPDRES